MNKAVFLDRDGTINVDKGYVYKIEDWEFIKGVKEGLKILQDLEYRLIIITNQSGIARGYYNEADAIKLHNYMIEELKKEDIRIDRVYYCPHIGNECNCRKPKLELFYQAQKDYNLDFTKCYAIGDKLRDLAICDKEKVNGFLLNETEIINNSNILRCKNLCAAAEKIKEWGKLDEEKRIY